MSDKQPMSKTKKGLIASIISIVTGVMLLIAGVFTTLKGRSGKDSIFALGLIILCCGAAVLSISIYSTCILAKKLKAENK